MSGYTPVFSEIYMGTLYGKWPAAPVWASLLPLCDQHGRIDVHPAAIAGMTGWPLDLLMEGIRQLCEPDEHSRTPDDDGRRLVLLEEGRSWGWRVVNHAKYREKARLVAKNAREVAEGKNRDRMAGRTAADRRSPPDTAADPLSNTNTNKDKNPRKRGKPAKARMPEGFALTPELAAYVTAKIPDCNATALFEQFCGQAMAKAWEYADWEQAFQTYVRNVAPNSGHWASGQYPRGGNGVTRWR